MRRVVSAVTLVALGVAGIGGCSIAQDGEDSVAGGYGSNQFAAGGVLNVTDPVEGDAFLAGGKVAIASEIKGDLVVTGGDVSVGGSVEDDLYAAGGDVKLDAIVSGNARLAGGDIAVGPATVVAGTVSLTGARVSFEGNSHEDLHASGASVRIDGEVHGDAEVRAEELVIGPGTRIGGRLVYHGPAEPIVPEGAVIDGGLEFHQAGAGWFLDRSGEPRRDRHSRGGSLLWFVGVFGAATIFVLLFPGYSTRAADAIGREPLRVIGLGLAIVICAPFVGVVLLITIIGIPLALLAMPLYVLLLFLGWVTAALFLAQRGLAAARAGRPVTNGWRLLALFLALGALWLVRQVPFVGGLLAFVALLAGVGALVWQAWARREPPPLGVA